MDRRSQARARGVGLALLGIGGVTVVLCLSWPWLMRRSADAPSAAAEQPLAPGTSPASADDAVSDPQEQNPIQHSTSGFAEQPSPPSEAAPAPRVASSATARVDDVQSATSASPPRPTERELEAAIRATPIVMFSTTWCPVCERARAFLGANGFTYSERDIDRDSRALAELKRRSGKAAVPTLEIAGELLEPGFSQKRVMRAVVRDVEKRLGVKSIELKIVE